MKKTLYCIKGTVVDIFRGKVNVLYQIPNCWNFYGFKYEFMKSLERVINVIDPAPLDELFKRYSVEDRLSSITPLTSLQSIGQKLYRKWSKGMKIMDLLKITNK